ncbi:MAG: RHS repeat-associated core domain-containing protein [Oceanospirillaceae bacterium]|nr:RHS repeat-associated core domain-containing protein [Oceanospirillaceae bacterium]
MRTNTGNALQAGWNQSVLPISAPVATADYVKNNPLSSIWYFSQAEQRWYYWVKGQGGSLAQLQPGQIYWLLSPRAQTLAQDYGLCGAKGCEMYFQHSDHLGSVLLETRSDGSVNQRSRYRPYGAPLGEQQTKPYSFSAKEQDLSGLYYFEARYYDPLSARFISPDPLFATAPEKCVQSVVECNLYQYAGNSPLVMTDPTGKSVWTKAAKFIYHGGDLAATFADVVDNTRTLLDPNASSMDKLVAGLELLSEAFPVSVGDVKDGVKAVDKGLSIWMMCAMRRRLLRRG